MRPGSAIEEISDGVGSYPERFCEASMTFSKRPSISDRADFIPREFCVVASSCQAPLLGGIAHIVHIRAKEEMLQIHAGAIVTGMKKIKPWGNGPAREKPRNTMALLHFPREPEDSVPIALSSDPGPAPRGLFYLLPKPMLDAPPEVMSRDKAHGLAFRPAKPGIGFPSNLRRLPAPTLAEMRAGRRDKGHVKF